MFVQWFNKSKILQSHLQTDIWSSLTDNNNWDYLPIQISTNKLSMTLHHDHHLKMIHNYYSVLKIKKYKREVRGAAPHLAPEQLLFSFWNSWSGEPKRSCSPKVTNVEGKKGGAAPEQRGARWSRRNWWKIVQNQNKFWDPFST